MINLKVPDMDALSSVRACKHLSCLLLLLPVPDVLFILFYAFQEAAELLSRDPALVDAWKSGCSSFWGQHVVDVPACPEPHVSALKLCHCS